MVLTIFILAILAHFYIKHEKILLAQEIESSFKSFLNENVSKPSLQLADELRKAQATIEKLRSINQVLAEQVSSVSANATTSTLLFIFFFLLIAFLILSIIFNRVLNLRKDYENLELFAEEGHKSFILTCNEVMFFVDDSTKRIGSSFVNIKAQVINNDLFLEEFSKNSLIFSEKFKASLSDYKNTIESFNEINGKKVADFTFDQIQEIGDRLMREYDVTAKIFSSVFCDLADFLLKNRIFNLSDHIRTLLIKNFKNLYAKGFSSVAALILAAILKENIELLYLNQIFCDSVLTIEQSFLFPLDGLIFDGLRGVRVAEDLFVNFVPRQGLTIRDQILENFVDTMVKNLEKEMVNAYQTPSAKNSISSQISNVQQDNDIGDSSQFNLEDAGNQILEDAGHQNSENMEHQIQSSLI